MRKLTLILMLATVLTCTGCNSAQIKAMQDGVAKLQLSTDNAAQELAKLQDKRIELIKQIEDMPDGREKERARAVVQEIAQTSERIEEGFTVAAQKLGELKDALANAQDGWEVAAATLNTAAGVVPQPWGTYLGLAGALIGSIGVVQAKRLKAAATNTVRSVQPVMDVATPEQKAAVRKAQTNAAAKLVDSTQKA